ncbi:MAG TPA: hypothetical protein VL996_14425 [Methylocella sp.]|nr:hypothetical protein [Methylocella sp.]
MHFAVLTSVAGQSQSVTSRAGLPAHLRKEAPSFPRPRRRGRFAWGSTVTALALLGLFYAIVEWNKLGQASLPSPRPVTAPLPAWIEIANAPDIFSLAAPEFAESTKHHLARRHRSGGGRQDIFAFGGTREGDPLLNLLIYQPGGEAPPDSSFYVELARRAAETGRAIIRAEQPGEMATRFGVFEVARLGLARDGAPPEECLGFRFANAEPVLRITGFACGGEAPMPTLASKTALACLIDRIDLAPAAGDKGLIDFFAAHYAIRSPNCEELKSDPVPLPPAPFRKPVKRLRSSDNE